MSKWEVIFARTLSPVEHGVRRSAGQGGVGSKKAPKPGFKLRGLQQNRFGVRSGFLRVSRSRAGALTRTGAQEKTQGAKNTAFSFRTV
jgi:hypothetical protein